MAGKTVFILGAGFSFDAGIPMQGDLLQQILSYELIGSQENDRQAIFDFIEEVFGLTGVQTWDLALEDIYTPLHQAVTRNEYLKSYSRGQLKKVENSLNLLISHVIDNGKEGVPWDCGYVENFITHLVDTKRHAPTSDQFSILSLNWDIVLDKRLFSRVEADGVIDYGCNCVGVLKTGGMIPPLVAKERGKYTIKLLKLHGSLNWVTCPKCSRVFVNKHEKEGIRAFKRSATCRFCEGDIKLDAAILLPTFQKDFAKLHYQQIWNQAGIELSEATKIVFIGYSFPLADFDFRALITKHVGDVEVEVVLKSHDGNPTDEGKRYQNYFGDKLQEVHYGGAADYINNHLEI